MPVAARRREAGRGGRSALGMAQSSAGKSSASVATVRQCYSGNRSGLFSLGFIGLPWLAGYYQARFGPVGCGIEG
jgi:hypothetical protein